MVRISRVRRLIVLITMLSTALWILTPGVALAAATNAPCDTADPDNPHDGTWRHGATVGAEARIESNVPLLCTGPNQGYSGSFTYVAAEISGGTLSIVQIGVGKCNAPYNWCTGSYRIFYAWGRDSSTGTCTSDRGPAGQDLGPAPSGVHTYTVYRTTTQVVFKVDGAIVETVPIANVSCWNGDNFSATGEVTDYSDQLGGSAANHQNITAMKFQTSVGGTWTSTSVISCASDIPGFFDCQRISNTAVDIWTDRS